VIDAALLRQLSEDRALASQMLFPHRHPQSSPEYHIEIIDLWRASDEFVVIEAFREGAKSTLSEEFLTLEGCFGNFRYCLLVGETYSKACQRLAAIDYEARTNIRLHQTFGGPVLARKSIENKVWFKTGAMIEAVGWEQELQSFKHNDARPDRAYLDDPENQERVRDKDAVDASMRKLYLELIPALDKTNRKVRLTQTRRAEDCMVTRLASSPEWLYRAFPICDGEPDDPKTKAIWPSRYPMEWVRAEYRRYRDAGMLGEFNQAYRLIVMDPAKKPFTEDMLSAADPSSWSFMPKAAIFDPARSSDPLKSDRYGKIVASKVGTRIYVHESGGFHWSPDEFVDDLFVTQERHDCFKMGIEKNSLDDWLMSPIRHAILKRGVPLPIVTMQAPQDRSKEDFIRGLEPFAKARDIVLVGGRVAHPQLVAEWCNFPQGPRDVLNALAYVLRLFAGQPVYEDFSGSNVQEAPDVGRGDTVHVAWNASSSEVVAVAVVAQNRRYAVAADYARAGPTRDAVDAIRFELRAKFPTAAFQHYVPTDVFDQWQRIALVPALRSFGVVPMRASHVAVARGSLAAPMRTVVRNARCLTVDRRAANTLNALGGGYSYPIAKGVPQHEPEPGIPRLTAEALETLVHTLSAQTEVADLPAGANIAYSPSGARYVTSNPSRR